MKTDYIFTVVSDKFEAGIEEPFKHITQHGSMFFVNI